MVNTPQEWLIAENNMGITPANFKLADYVTTHGVS